MILVLSDPHSVYWGSLQDALKQLESTVNNSTQTVNITMNSAIFLDSPAHLLASNPPDCILAVGKTQLTLYLMSE
jgi:hypothetical protein